ncbi:MAG: hypothetical protein NTZ80_02355 [Patescibacteria group bacterium]|nr:hypothetical protein [Patescibacteria group bacterium]
MKFNNKFSVKIAGFLGWIALCVVILNMPLAMAAQGTFPAWNSFDSGFRMPSAGRYDNALTASGGEDYDIMVSVRKYLDFFLGFVAVMLLVAAFYSGWEYLTAWSDADKAKKGLASMRYAIFGLVIVTVAFALTRLLVKGLPSGNVDVDNATPGTTGCEYKICESNLDCVLIQVHGLLKEGICTDGCCQPIEDPFPSFECDYGSCGAEEDCKYIKVNGFNKQGTCIDSCCQPIPES